MSSGPTRHVIADGANYLRQRQAVTDLRRVEVPRCAGATYLSGQANVAALRAPLSPRLDSDYRCQWESPAGRSIAIPNLVLRLGFEIAGVVTFVQLA